MVRERRKPVMKEVTLKVTDHEKVEMAERAGELRKEKTVIAEQFQRVKAEFKGKIEAKEGEISELLGAISDGKVTRKVEVVEIFDADSNEVEVEYNGEVIEVRKMTPDEREQSARFKQPELPMDIPPPVPQSPPASLGSPEPWTVTLPKPEEGQQPIYVPGEADRPTKVVYLATTWRQEAGEAGTYEVVTEDVFGQQQLGWKRAGALTVSDKQPEPINPEQPAAPAEEVPQ